VMGHGQRQASVRGAGAMKRRTLLAMSALAAGCGRKHGPQFGKVIPPASQQVVMAIGAAVATLDPGPSWDIWEPYAIRSLFEGLTDYHPTTLEPIAAIATHYQANSDGTQFTFYLRGHRNPRGSPLDGLSDGGQFDPAKWSDGKTITAEDFVYSWRRAVDPANAFPTASLFYPIRNAQAINSRNAPPEALGVRALEGFTFQVDLREPVPHFLQMVATNQFFPVPRQVVERAGSFWTAPNRMVNSGAFRLLAWRDDEILLVKNSTYYDADHVRLQQLRLIAVSSQATIINLYKAGKIDLVTPLIPALHLRSLRQTLDYHAYPAVGNNYLVLNTRNSPLDNVLVRYALNMAIDKREIERFKGSGPAALGLLPPLDRYPSPRALPVMVRGRICDVLAFDPPAARSLMSAAGFAEGRRLKIEYLYPMQGDHRSRFEILQKQLREYLGVELIPVPKETSIYNQETFSLQYRGISAWADIALYQDPTYFLDQFLAGAPANVTGWTDERYDDVMMEARACAEPLTRLKRLADCERMLLRAMPVIPLYFDAWHQLRKPYVHGIDGNSIASIAFRNAWVDTNWRPVA
jgi:ABC-type oligopeptide transport system substrate-binding subunit